MRAAFREDGDRAPRGKGILNGLKDFGLVYLWQHLVSVLLLLLEVDNSRAFELHLGI